ncbi:MAG TPA: DUF4435 domain-containing protein [Blastocatellia bacterium]|nr:DUF4435 domain-containing protein [Blastocatellia bacterium]
MRTISSLPPELTRLLFDAGTRIIVLVEGDDDRYVLREWFGELLSEVEFYDCGGISNLNKWLEDLLSYGALKRAYSITDRDFRDETEVNNSYEEGSHRFILRRYALENYLLSPRPLWEVLTLRHPPITADLPDEQAMETRLLEICRMLKSVTAANLAYFDENRTQHQSSRQTARLEYFSIGHHHDRHIVIKQAAKQLKCDEEDCEKRIAEREEIIEGYLTNLNSARQVIDGKRILHWVNNDLFITGRDYLFRLLTDRAKLRGLPDDIVIIVQDRILGSART